MSLSYLMIGVTTIKIHLIDPLRKKAQTQLNVVGYDWIDTTETPLETGLIATRTSRKGLVNEESPT